MEPRPEAKMTIFFLVMEHASPQGNGYVRICDLADDIRFFIAVSQILKNAVGILFVDDHDPVSYTHLQRETRENTSRMMQFLDTFSDNMTLSESDIAVNSLRLQDGMLIKIRDDYYLSLIHI